MIGQDWAVEQRWRGSDLLTSCSSEAIDLLNNALRSGGLRNPDLSTPTLRLCFCCVHFQHVFHLQHLPLRPCFEIHHIVTRLRASSRIFTHFPGVPQPLCSRKPDTTSRLFMHSQDPDRSFPPHTTTNPHSLSAFHAHPRLFFSTTFPIHPLCLIFYIHLLSPPRPLIRQRHGYSRRFPRSYAFYPFFSPLAPVALSTDLYKWIFIDTQLTYSLLTLLFFFRLREGGKRRRGGGEEGRKRGGGGGGGGLR